MIWRPDPLRPRHHISPRAAPRDISLNRCAPYSACAASRAHGPGLHDALSRTEIRGFEGALEGMRVPALLGSGHRRPLPGPFQRKLRRLVAGLEPEESPAAAKQVQV